MIMFEKINPKVYTVKLTEIKDSSEAWDVGEQIFETTLENYHVVLDKEILFNFLREAMKLQREDGFVALWTDDAMPCDAKVDIIYKPTYAIAAIAIYAFEQYPNDFDEELENFLQMLLTTFYGGIIGHGFEANTTIEKTMQILSKDYVKKYIETYPEKCFILKEIIEHYVKAFKRAVAEARKYNLGDVPTDVFCNIQKVASYWEGKPHAIFVYGTLLSGERANDMLDNADFCGKFYLKDCAMYNLGSYPGIISKENETVVGEVYFVDDETLENLDRYEGEGSLYERRFVTAKNRKYELKCQAYFYLGEVDEDNIMRRPYNAKENEYVWYAGYGSNLNEERFNCYIKGGVCSANGIRYHGCADKSDFLETKTQSFRGRMYFGNSSRSWCGKGVAFFNENGNGKTQMKLYKITRGQLTDVQRQEGMSSIWYGKTVFLGFDEDDCEIYTFTSEELRRENEPAPEYLNLIKNALKKECKYSEKSVLSYIEKCKLETEEK